MAPETEKSLLTGQEEEEEEEGGGGGETL